MYIENNVSKESQLELPDSIQKRNINISELNRQIEGLLQNRVSLESKVNEMENKIKALENKVKDNQT